MQFLHKNIIIFILCVTCCIGGINYILDTQKTNNTITLHEYVQTTSTNIPLLQADIRKHTEGLSPVFVYQSNRYQLQKNHGDITITIVEKKIWNHRGIAQVNMRVPKTNEATTQLAYNQVWAILVKPLNVPWEKLHVMPATTPFTQPLSTKGNTYKTDDYHFTHYEENDDVHVKLILK